MPINIKNLYYVLFDEIDQPFSHFCGVFDSKKVAHEFCRKDAIENECSLEHYIILPLDINKWV